MKVYKYGIKAPTAGLEDIDNQLSLAHKFRNQLTELENKRRAEIREAQLRLPLIKKLSEEIKLCSTHISETVAQIKEIRAKNRSRTKAPKELSDKRKALAAERKELGVKLKEAKAKEADALSALYNEIEDRAKAASKKARQEISKEGLYWSTYNHRVDAANKARQATAKKMAPENDLRFKRWDGSGVIAVQIQGGLPSEDVFGSNQQIQIGPVDIGAWHHEVRGERRRRSRTVLRFRVSSDAKRKPVWAEFPMVMHRNLPKASIIKSAIINIENIGEKRRYSLHVTVDDTLTEVFIPPDRKLAVAIDVGWRKKEEGIRVAVWHDSKGCSGELVLPQRILDAIKQVDDLKSIRDNRLNAMKPMLLPWLKANKTPKWLTEITEHIHLWKAQSRFNKLWGTWRDNRFKGDEEIFAALAVWRKKDKHLYEWECNQRDQVYAHRRELYRVFAAELANSYEWLGVEKFVLSDMNQKSDVEADKENPSELISTQNFAAISVLREALNNAFRSRHGAMISVSAKDTTRMCNDCNEINHWDQATVLVKRCHACNAVWDQDFNAAKNILDLTLDLVASGKAAKSKPSVKLGKYQRAALEKMERSQVDDQTMDIDKVA